MELDLFAGLPVTRFAEATDWYVRLLGGEPAFFPHDTEAVWELAEHRYLYVVEDPARAGHAVVTLFVEDLDERLEKVAQRGLEPARQETFGEGVRKITFRDADGNEVSFGGGPG